MYLIAKYLFHCFMCYNVKEQYGSRLMANVFYLAGFIEFWGRGYEKIREGFEKAGLPMPKIEDVEGGVRVTFNRNNVSNSRKTGLSERLPDELSEKLSNRLSNTTFNICMFIVSDKNISRKELAEKTGISTTAVQKHLNKLKSLGIIKRIGSAKNGYWEIIDDKES